METGPGWGRFPYFYGPEGRLIQVDYALQAVNQGSTTIGIKNKNFILLSSRVKPTTPLVEPAEKIYTIDDHIGATGSGHIGDILRLVDIMRVEAQSHRLTFDSPIDVGSLAKAIGSYVHSFTIYTVRPIGASVIMGGVDTMGLQLYLVDPSGTFFSGSALAIGQSATEALEIIHKEYSDELTVEDAIGLTTKAIETAIGEKSTVEHGIVRLDTRRFEKLK